MSEIEDKYNFYPHDVYKVLISTMLTIYIVVLYTLMHTFICVYVNIVSGISRKC